MSLRLQFIPERRGVAQRISGDRKRVLALLGVGQTLRLKAQKEWEGPQSRGKHLWVPGTYFGARHGTPVSSSLGCGATVKRAVISRSTEEA